MEKKGVYFARKFILAVGVFFLLLILPAVNAEAKEVSLVKGDAIRYMGYSTHYYYVDGNSGILSGARYEITGGWCI